SADGWKTATDTRQWWILAKKAAYYALISRRRTKTWKRSTGTISLRYLMTEILPSSTKMRAAAASTSLWMQTRMLESTRSVSRNPADQEKASESGTMFRLAAAGVSAWRS